MARMYKSGTAEGGEYSIVYSDMRGVDFSGDGSSVDRSRFSYLENMYRDYEGEGDGAIESIPGFRRIARLGAKINGLFSYKDELSEDCLIIHSGTELYRLPLSEMDSTLTPASLATVCNARSRSFNLAGRLFILDGADIFAIAPSGECKKASVHTELCHIPTTFINGKEYRQRNLLTRLFKERYTVGSAERNSAGTPELKYTVTDEERRLCAVAGIEDSYTGEVLIPAYTLIGDTPYLVHEICDRAFLGNTGISSVFIAGGVTKIGKFAFGDCTNLTSAVLSDSVTEIDNACFDTCERLSELHLGRGLRTLGSSVISMCGALNKITYSGNEADFAKIDNTEVLGDTAIIYDTEHREITLSLPIFSPAVKLSSITSGGKSFKFYLRRQGNLITEALIYLNNRAEAVGCEFIIEGELSADSSDYGGFGGFLSSSFGEGADPRELILGCTLCECFDGRVFLAGNPSQPNAVFYSERMESVAEGELYFGEYNYFCDGTGGFNTASLLCCGSALAVFKEGDDGGGSIYYHTPRDTGIDLIPRIYPTEYIHSGICAIGDAISFFDDPVFISEYGLSALDKRQINLERSIAHRSHNVNSRLLCENLKEARLTVWQGYLALCAGGHMYLADSRATFIHSTGSREYEWYYLTDIGSYLGGEGVYRHCSIPTEGYTVNADMADRRVDPSHYIYSSKEGNKTVRYYIEDGQKIEVYPTEERYGGDFSPACAIHAVGHRLFFGTDDGTVCVFNNDKRGVAPKALQNDEDFNPEEYRLKFGRQIHPSYYSFDNRAVRYALRTALDNGGIPHMLKSSVKRSLAIKCRSFAAGRLICEVGTNRSGYRELCEFPASSLSFADFDFSAPSLTVGDSTTIAISERERGWVEKQISLYSDEYCAPIGIYSIAYRFRLSGGLKKNR